LTMSQSSKFSAKIYAVLNYYQSIVENLPKIPEGSTGVRRVRFG
jgi:hypothetical protein